MYLRKQTASRLQFAPSLIHWCHLAEVFARRRLCSYMKLTIEVPKGLCGKDKSRIHNYAKKSVAVSCDDMFLLMKH